MDGVGLVPFALSKAVILTTYIIAAGFIGLYGIYLFPFHKCCTYIAFNKKRLVYPVVGRVWLSCEVTEAAA